MKTLAVIRLKRMDQEDALSKTVECWNYLKETYVGKVGQGEQFSAVQIHAVEIYLSMATVVFDSSREDSLTTLPWKPHRSLRWAGFCDWYKELRKLGLHWEAQKIQRILLPIVGEIAAMNIFVQPDQFPLAVTGISAQQVDESLVLTDLIASNSICEYLMGLDPPSISLAGSYLRASRSLKEVLSLQGRLDGIGHARTLLRIDELGKALNRAKLLQAAEKGDEKLVKRLLTTDEVDPNCKDRHGQTPLLYAAKGGYKDAVDLLLAKGAFVNFKNQEGRTPLSYAVENGQRDLSKVLLEQGAEVDSRDRKGQTPLFYTIGKNQRDMAQLLLENRAEVDSKDQEGRTAFSYAVEMNQDDVARLLLEWGAEVDAKDLQGRTPLWYAVNHWIRMAYLLLGIGAEVNAKDRQGRTPLSYAAENDWHDMVRLLLHNRAEVNSKDLDGRTPLWYAKEKNLGTMVTLLLDNGAEDEP
jgi:ankyrin repeat protein